MPFDPDITRTYELTPGNSPLDALCTVQRGGLGRPAVRLVDGRLVFRNPEHRQWAAGHWQVKAIASNAPPQDDTLIEIPVIDPADGST